MSNVVRCGQVCSWNVGTFDCADDPFANRCVKPDGVACPLSHTPVKSVVKNNQEAKADDGKLKIHLVPMQIVRDICEVREYGNRKYGDPDNWKQVELMRYVDALLRHTLCFANDIHSVDEESGIAHYKHMECNLAFISEMLKDWKGDTNGRVCSATAEVKRE